MTQPAVPTGQAFNVVCMQISTTQSHMCYIYFYLVQTRNAINHLWVSFKFALISRTFLISVNHLYIWGCVLKEYGVLKVKNALLTSVYYITDGTICNVVRIGLLCPWFRKELQSPASNLKQRRTADVMQFTWARSFQGWPKLSQKWRVCTPRPEKSTVLLRASFLFRFSASV